MSTIVTYMFILMIFSLILGFFLGWILRRSTYNYKYERKLSELALKRESLKSKYRVHSIQTENHLGQLKNIENDIKDKKLTLQTCINHNKKLSIDIDDLHNEESSIREDMNDLEKKVYNSTDKLNKLTSNANEILQYKDNIKNYKKQIKDKNVEIEIVSNKIGNLSHDKKILDREIEAIERNILSSQIGVQEQDKKIEQLYKEFEEKSLKVTNDIDLTRYKALNYQYALKYANEKLFANEEISFDTIDKIIDKNEQQKPFENILKKLFTKSAKYIKEER